ncbi:MAG: hypothetical protein GY714_10945 [Desulfobacterales bacterium]|nr:hypothetical protein [Desulfobacterales bacterium]
MNGSKPVKGAVNKEKEMGWEQKEKREKRWGHLWKRLANYGKYHGLYNLKGD